MLRIVIVGATSLIAEKCAFLWLLRNDAVDLTLVGRDEIKLSSLKARLSLANSKGKLSCHVSSLTGSLEIRKTVELISGMGHLDIVLIAHATMPEQNECLKALALCEEVMNVTGISPILFAEAFASRMQGTYSTVAVIGSISGDRGRGSNYVYGSAKSLVERYIQGMQHRFCWNSMNILLVKPGPTNTPLVKNKYANNKWLADPQLVAEDIVDAIQQRKKTVYTPRRWALFMLVFRNIPGFIFDRLRI